MTPVYLFCNHGFGWHFSQRALRFATKRRIKLTVVYSDKVNSGSVKRNHSIPERLAFFIKKSLMCWHAGTGSARVLHVPDVNSPEFIARVEHNSHGIVAGFDQIFARESISRFATLVNFHPSVLPYYRGPIPSYWVLKHGEKQSGYTLHRITERIDCGPILFQEVVPCADLQSEEQLNTRLAKSALTTFDRYIEHLIAENSWQVTTVDADRVYRVHLGYGRKVAANKRT